MAYEPRELSEVKEMPTEELHAKIAEKRSIGSGYEVLQLLADTSKPVVESGKDSTR
jgi:hypothetical protein